MDALFLMCRGAQYIIKPRNRASRSLFNELSIGRYERVLLQSRSGVAQAIHNEHNRTPTSLIPETVSTGMLSAMGVIPERVDFAGGYLNSSGRTNGLCYEQTI
jgi:hypothetical protein